MKFTSIAALTALITSASAGDGMCTTIGIGPAATIDGSTMVTHTADCKDCDFRIAKTPPKTHDLEANPDRPIYRYRRQYPRLVASERGSTWSPSNLESEFADEWASKDYTDSQIVGYIPQVKETYGLFESLFAIMNDQQVAIGESTSSARFGENAVPRSCPTCDGPLVDVAAISLIALERCDTAKCAVQMMGDLATTYGYYGAETGEGDRGEALTVSDPKEVYMMHLTPDPTSLTAVWVARKVPDGHVTAAANAFVIRGVDPDTDLYSSNLWSVAKDAGVDQYDENGLLDFAKTYGPDEFTKGLMKKPEYSNDRVWRVFSLLAPSRGFKRETDFWGSDFPFSVEVENKVSVADVMRLNRDHYEGSEFDLTQGFAAGPYNNPVRYDPGFGWPGQTGNAPNENNLTTWERMHGAFPRAIGIMRTSWHFVAQARPNMPNEVGGILHFAQHQPLTATYAPLYASIEDVPSYYKTGSLYGFNEDSMFWAFCSLGNYAQLAWKYIFPDIHDAQSDIENSFFQERSEIDEKAMKILKDDGHDAVVKYLTNYVDDAADNVFTSTKRMFHHILGKFHDGNIALVDKDIFDASEYFYPQWWLKHTTFFTAVLKDKDFSLEGIPVALNHVYTDSVASALGGGKGSSGGVWGVFGMIFFGLCCGFMGGFIGVRLCGKNGGYQIIAD